MGTRQRFIGRERELAELESGLEAAAVGRGRLFLVVGKAGIGKTRLAEQAAAAATARGFRVEWGRSGPQSGAPPYWHWIQMLRGLITAGDANIDLDAETAGALLDLVPEIRDRHPEPALPPPLEPEHARFYLFDVVTSLLRRASGLRPLFVVLDDLHAADAASLRLLRFLAPELAEMAVVVLGAYREEDLRPNPDLSSMLSDIARRATSLPLRGFSENQVEDFVVARFEVSPSRDAVVRLHEASGGNPFLLDGVLRAVASAGRLERLSEVPIAHLEIPTAVRDAIAHRLAELPAATRRSLVLASVVGREFDVGLLGRVSERTVAETLALLDPAVSADLVSPLAGAPGRYAFAHDLVREALYEEQPPTLLPERHRRVAEALESIHATDPTPHLDALAHHFTAAALGGEGRQKAIDYSMRAGQRAAETLAHEAAVAHYSRALQLMEVAPHGPAERCELRLALAAAQVRTGEGEQARDSVARAARLARENGWSERLARAALTLGVSAWAPGTVDPDLVQLLEEALAALPPGDSLVRARMLARLAVALYWSDQRERSALLSRDAVAMARHLGDAAALATALVARHLDLGGPEHLQERFEISREALLLARRCGRRELEVSARFWRISDLFEAGDVRGVDGEATALAHAAEATRQPLFRWLVLLVRVTRAHLAGNFEEAERLAEETLRIGRSVQPVGALAHHATHQFLLRRERGELGGFERTVRMLADQQPNVPGFRCGLAYLYAEEGDREQARRELEIVAADDFRRIPRDPFWLSAMALLSSTCALLGDRARAAILYDQILPFARRNFCAARCAPGYGVGAHFLGVLAATLDRCDDAERHLTEALEMHERMGARPHVARSRTALAAVILVRGERERALPLLDRAIDEAQLLGMKRVAAYGIGLRERPAAIAPAVPPIAAETDRATASEAVFARDGALWLLRYQGRVCRLRATKGLAYIAQLLASPGERRPAAELCGAAPGNPSADAEQARLNVTRAIRGAFDRIAEHDPALAQHLRGAIKTGATCVYRPDSRAAIRWQT